MFNTARWAAAVGVAALAFALNCGVASAQLQKAPEAKDPAPKAAAPKTTKAPAKPKSACSALTATGEAACKADVSCQWVAATKSKKGKEIKAYCRTAPKKAPAKKAPAAASKAPAKAPAKDAAPKN